MSAPSHHRPGGGFQNPWGPGSQQARFGQFLRWALFERPRTTRRRTPDRATFGAAHQPVAPSFAVRESPDMLAITWIGHSSFLVQIAGQNLLLDPVWGDRASPISWLGPRRWTPPGIPFDALPPIDGVILSHDHYDHLDQPTVRRLVKRFPGAQWRAPLGVGQWLRRRGVSQVREADWWDQTDLGPLQLTATPAQHFSGRRLDNRNGTLWCGWVIRSGGHTVFFAGDTGAHPVFPEIGQRQGPFDAVLMPIGAYDPEWFMGPVHIDPERAVASFQALSASAADATMVAMHWGTFQLTDEPMDEPPKRAIAAWANAGLPPHRLWIPSHGETRRWPLHTH
ncbi:MAG TPA: MBL fold metallo-hydrolase [Gemmatimonadaceae bacterium]|nr:MBL fold metallo-hydrolase [Gemmatimonadaceae bacterium]